MQYSVSAVKPILRKIDAGRNSFSIREDILPYLYNHWHYHPEVELTLIRKGRGTRLVGDSLEPFAEGDLILLGKNLPHLWRGDGIYFKKIPGLKMEAIAIHFQENCLGDGFFQLPEMKMIHDLLQKARRGIKLTGKLKADIVDKMEGMLRAKDAERITLLLDILHLIAVSSNTRILSSAGFTRYYDVSNTDRINLIYDYTFNNFQDKMTIADVAKISSISKHSFCRYFKTRTLKTYWQFLMEIRIGQACKFLIESDMSVAQVCYACGFNNLSNFNRYFKKLVRETPLQFAKEHRDPGIEN